MALLIVNPFLVFAFLSSKTICNIAVCSLLCLTQVQLTIPPPGYIRPPWATNLTLLVEGSHRAKRYLENYASLFESREAYDVGIPSWDAILWITEHYKNPSVEETPLDMLYQKEVGFDWTRDAPVVVRANGVFCDMGPHRILWAPNAIIDLWEYNWPVIEGRFYTFFECTTAYILIFETHKIHQDPVCFHAAIFAHFLVQICITHHICINVNQYESSHFEFFINMKLRYLPTRHLQMVEIMCVIHFIYNDSLCFINEFRGGRKKTYDKWL